MANEILIPVRRRHAATRAQLETMVTYPQHWGYAEDEELTLTRLISGARRYSSRSALCRPQTMFDPIVNVDTHDCVGINTLTQLNNVGSAAGDFYVDAGTTGLHIKSRQTTYGDTAFLILEGYGEGANGHSEGYDGTKVIMCSSISAANQKMFLIGSGGSFIHFDSLNDDKTINQGDILVLNGYNSNVGIGTGHPDYTLDVYRIGVVKQVLDMIRMHNDVYDADMIGTGVGIKFDLTANGNIRIESGKISVYCEQNMSGTWSTQDATMAFATCLNGVLTNKVYIDSAGTMGVGITPWTTWSPNVNALQVGKLGSVFSNIAESGRTSFAHNIINEAGQWATKSSVVEGGGLLALEGNAFVFYNTVAQVAGSVSLINRFYITDIGNIQIGTDSVELQFGEHQDVKLIHAADTGLKLRAGVTTTGAVLSLETIEDSVVVSDVLGRINFSAPAEASGGDSILVGASIVAIAEDTFSATVNKTSLVFQTGISEVASTKMILNSAGNLGIGAAVVFDASAVGCLALTNATAPAAHTDNQIYVYSADSLNSKSTLALYTEEPVLVLAAGCIATLEVLLNGVPYNIMLASAT
jgi:hypothetical protein